jgi:PII-like signaling protein
MNSSKSSILKIYASSTDKIGNKLLFEHIVVLARGNNISGATVYRGIMGYGQSSKINSSKFWELTEKLPVVIELIDSSEKIQSFYNLIEESLKNMPKGCLVTVEDVEVKLHKTGKTTVNSR